MKSRTKIVLLKRFSNIDSVFASTLYVFTLLYLRFVEPAALNKVVNKAPNELFEFIGLFTLGAILVSTIVYCLSLFVSSIACCIVCNKNLDRCSPTILIVYTITMITFFVCIIMLLERIHPKEITTAFQTTIIQKLPNQGRLASLHTFSKWAQIPIPNFLNMTNTDVVTEDPSEGFRIGLGFSVPLLFTTRSLMLQVIVIVYDLFYFLTNSKVQEVTNSPTDNGVNDNLESKISFETPRPNHHSSMTPTVLFIFITNLRRIFTSKPLIDIFKVLLSTTILVLSVAGLATYPLLFVIIITSLALLSTLITLIITGCFHKTTVSGTLQLCFMHASSLIFILVLCCSPKKNKPK
jgi:hypothetical protein